MLLSFFLLGSTAKTSAQDSAAIRRISDEIMSNNYAYENLRVLCKTIGHRLSGSQQYDAAVKWGQAALLAAGADRVWLQPVDVPKWVRGQEALFIVKGKKKISIPVLSLGNSEGTEGKWYKGNIVRFSNIDALKAAPAADIAGKIVFMDYKFRHEYLNAFEGYGDMVKYRFVGVNEASKKGAMAYVMRSVSTGLDDAPHTGVTFYEDSVRKIPAMAIGNTTADRLVEWLNSGETIRAEMRSECGMHGTVRSYNVIGEIIGQKEGVIVVGGHLDSWDIGEGAQDDGAGCVQSIEVLRTFKKLNIKPNYTIRAVLFANEENGAKGGKAYADSAHSKGEYHVFALESDAGGYAPRGFSFVMPAARREMVKSWSPLFLPLGVYDFSQEGGGVDINPLKKLGVAVSGLEPDSQRYFDMHHSRNDVFEDVSKRELHLGATAMTALIYMIDKYWQ